LYTPGRPLCVDTLDLPATPSDASPAETIRIVGSIRILRGHRVLLDTDLAELYGVETRVLIQAVHRNLERFPEDFLFRLGPEEASRLRSQIVISSRRGGRRHRPYAFTEQGVAMLSGILRSPRAILVNVEIMRTFVRLRRDLVTHEDLARKVETLERRYDERFRSVFEALRALMPLPRPSRARIGFQGSGEGPV